MKINLFDRIKDDINSIENSKLHITYFILLFISAIALRGFWESYSDTPVGNLQDYTGPMIPHFFFWYIALALMLIFIIYLATRENVHKLTKIILPSFLILLVVPFIDIVFTLGKGANITYMLPGIHHDILIRWFTLTGSTPMGMGGTLGLKIEGILVTIFVFIYIFIKTKSIIRSAIFTFIIHSTIFWWGSLPYLIYFLQTLFNVEYIYSEALLTNFELLIIFIFGILTVYVYNKKYFIDIAKSINVYKISQFLLMFFLGIAIAWNQTQKDIVITQVSFFHWIFAPILIIFAYIFQLIIRHILSEEENLNEGILPKTIPLNFYKTIAIFTFIFIVVYSFAVDFTTTFLILFFIFSNFLYFNPILKIKKVVFLPKILIAQNFLAITLLGYYFSVGRLNQFPSEIILYFIIGFTFILNLIDIKNFENDKNGNIKTIPTIFGLKKGKIIIGSFFPIVLSVPGIILNEIFLTIGMIIVGIVDFILIYRENYKEKYILIINILILIVIIFYLINVPYKLPYL